MASFNDFLIIQHIASHLDKETLRCLLPEVKKIEAALDKDAHSSISLSSILHLLSHSSDDDPLLRDFLQCSGQQEDLEVHVT